MVEKRRFVDVGVSGDMGPKATALELSMAKRSGINGRLQGARCLIPLDEVQRLEAA
jgi:hypothetical protein